MPLPPLTCTVYCSYRVRKLRRPAKQIFCEIRTFVNCWQIRGLCRTPLHLVEICDRSYYFEFPSCHIWETCLPPFGFLSYVILVGCHVEPKACWSSSCMKHLPPMFCYFKAKYRIIYKYQGQFRKHGYVYLQPLFAQVSLLTRYIGDLYLLSLRRKETETQFYF